MASDLALGQDDGFYVMAVGRNIAVGNGITIDGHTKTNGFQPLWAILVALLFLLCDGDRELGVLAVLGLQWLLLLGSSVVLAMVFRDLFRGAESSEWRLRFWVAACVYVTGVLSFEMHFNLMETGLLLFMCSLLARAYQLSAIAGRTKRSVYLLMGLLVLTRIDTVFLVILLSALELRRPHAATTGLAECSRMLFAAGLLSLPWWLFNLLEFGNLMPSSGAAQTEYVLSLERARASYFALSQLWTQNGLRFVGSDGTGWFRLGLIGLTSVAAFRIVRSQADSIDETTKVAIVAVARFGGALIVGVGMLVLYYSTSSSATHFYTRYYAPIVLVGTCAISTILCWLGSHSRRLVAVVIGLFLGHLGLHLYTQIQTAPSDGYSFIPQLELVLEQVPSWERVGAWQSGTLGFYRDNVVNLDGKVNAEALKWRGKITPYLEQQKIRYVCDWPSIVEANVEPWRLSGWKSVASRGRFTLYERVESPR